MQRSYVYRYIWFFVGVVINSFGVAFITKADLGTSPISSIPYVLSLNFPLSFGAATFVFNILLILLQLVLLKKDFGILQVLQLVVTLVFSAFIDISMNLLFWLEPINIVEKLISLAVGCAILGFGISIEVAPSTLMVPGEGAVSVISSKMPNRKFGTIKIVFDVSLMLTAAILSIILSRSLDGLGIGTIISALIVGKFVNISNRYVPLIPKIASLKGQTT